MENSESTIRGVRSQTETAQASGKKTFFSNLISHLTLPEKSLIIFRWILGFLILLDLVQHFLDVTRFYGNEGIVPLHIALDFAAPWHHSVYFLSDDPIMCYYLYFIHMILAFFFMIGRGLPWVTGVLWFFQLSLRNRNFIICDGSDDLTIIFLFISIFLPLTPGAKKNGPEWSPYRNPIWNALWSLVFVTQMLCMYFFSALGKYDASWTKTFTASFLALRLENVSNPLGMALLNYPGALKVFTFLTYYLELIGPFVFLVCYLIPDAFSTRMKKIFAIFFILLHVGILITLRLWAFPLVCIAVWITLYPRNPDPVENTNSSLGEKLSLLAPITVLITILNWNIIEVKRDFVLPHFIQVFGQHFSLYQNWSMFAPYPMLNNQYFTFTGRTLDGKERTIDLQENWRMNRHRVKYLLNLNDMDHRYLNGFGNYLCAKNPDLKEAYITGTNSVMNKETFEITHPANMEWTQPCDNNQLPITTPPSQTEKPEHPPVNSSPDQQS